MNVVVTVTVTLTVPRTNVLVTHPILALLAANNDFSLWPSSRGLSSPYFHQRPENPGKD